jgi:hypothetical protein
MADYYSSFNGLAFGPTSTGAFEIGDFATSNRDVKFALDSATRPAALDICCDDGGVALTAGEVVRPLRARMLLRTAIASGAHSVFGAQSQLKIAAVSIANTSRGAGGLYAYLEIVAGATLTGDWTAVKAQADLEATATQSSGTISGVQIDSLDLSGTSSGYLACIHIPTPQTGTWDYLFHLGTTTGVTSTSDVACTANMRIAVLIGDSVHYIPLIAGT